MHELKEIGMKEFDETAQLFLRVFTSDPWNDDWSDPDQLNRYLTDLLAQDISLAYGLYLDGVLSGVSMGYIKHWYSGTEYYINELFIRMDAQGKGLGTLFLKEIEEAVRKRGITRIFLQTESTVPAYGFYLKNGFTELKEHVSFTKQL